MTDLKALRKSDTYNDGASKIQEAYRNLYDGRKWLSYPRSVSIETYSKCNARCTFCPYTTLERIGSKLPKETVFGLIDEIVKFPTHPEMLNLTRVNEPFLDSHIFDYIEYANTSLPTTDIVLISNGQALTLKNINQLLRFDQFKMLIISLNEHDPDKYNAVMGLDQKITLRNLDRLHDISEKNGVPFRVVLSRVGSSDAEDKDFLSWAQNRYPLFQRATFAQYDWIGYENTTGDDLVPNTGCIQWFNLHILADGTSAFCCIDGFGGVQQLSIETHSLYEIYNIDEKRNLREKLHSRKQIKLCDSCIHGMPADAYVNV